MCKWRIFNLGSLFGIFMLNMAMKETGLADYRAASEHFPSMCRTEKMLLVTVPCSSKMMLLWVPMNPIVPGAIHTWSWQKSRTTRNLAMTNTCKTMGT